jgi:hypothetical protein
MKNEENAEKWEEAIEEIKNAFLDEVFDVRAKITREDFIKMVSKK